MAADRPAPTTPALETPTIPLKPLERPLVSQTDAPEVLQTLPPFSPSDRMPFDPSIARGTQPVPKEVLGPGNTDLQIQDARPQAKIAGPVGDLWEMMSKLPDALQAQLTQNALDLTGQYMKDKGGFDYKSTGSRTEDWSAIADAPNQMSPSDRNQFLKQLYKSTTDVLRAHNDQYRDGVFGKDNMRANFLWQKQQNSEKLSTHERNELDAYWEFPTHQIAAIIAARQANHEPVSSQEAKYVADLRRQREKPEQRIWEKPVGPLSNPDQRE